MQIEKNGGFTAVVTYNNKNKKWWVLDRSFESPRLTALHLIERANNEIQNSSVQAST